MLLFKQYVVEDYAAASAQVPVIDDGPCLAGEPGALDGVAADMRHACETVGFLYTLNRPPVRSGRYCLITIQGNESE